MHEPDVATRIKNDKLNYRGVNNLLQ